MNRAPITVSPADAQMVETRRYGRSEMMTALWKAGTSPRSTQITTPKASRTPIRG